MSEVKRATLASLLLLPHVATAAFAQCGVPALRWEFDYAGNSETTAAIDGATVIIGDPYVSTARIYTRQAREWALGETLSGSGNRLGAAVDIDGEWAVITAPHQDVDGWTDLGEARMIRRTEDGWAHVQTLTPSPRRDYRRFGVSASVRGRWLAIGANNDNDDDNMVFIFELQGDRWVETQILREQESREGVGSVALLENILLVATAPQYRDPQVHSYSYSDGLWQLTQSFSSEDDYEFFASDLAADGEWTIVSAWPSAAFLYRLSDGAWVQERRIGPSERRFGPAVALRGDFAAVGTFGCEDSYCGVDYQVQLFERVGEEWMDKGSILSPGSGYDRFGISIDIDDDALVAGTRGETLRPAYLYDVCPCDGVIRLSARCREPGEGGRYQVSARLRTTEGADAAYTLLFDGEHERQVWTSANGSARAKWRTRTLGFHEVAVLECPEFRQPVECGTQTCTGRENFRSADCEVPERVTVLLADGVPGRRVEFTLDGDRPVVTAFRHDGVAEASWEDAGRGLRQVSALLECGDVLTTSVTCPGAVACELISSFDVTCHEDPDGQGSFDIHASLTSTLEPGTLVTFELDDGRTAYEVVDAEGNASASWDTVLHGGYSARILECPQLVGHTACGTNPVCGDWRPLEVPVSQANHAMAYDARRREVVLFGDDQT